MKPYSPTGFTVEKRIFKYWLSRVRHIVENEFGIVFRFGVQLFEKKEVRDIHV